MHNDFWRLQTKVSNTKGCLNLSELPGDRDLVPDRSSALHIVIEIVQSTLVRVE